jgi:hypothetical protein
VRIKNQEFAGQARVLDRQQDDDLWQVVAELSRQKYGWVEGLPVEMEKVRSPLRFAICCILIVTTQPPESVHRFPSTCTAQLGNHLLSVSKICP